MESIYYGTWPLLLVTALAAAAPFFVGASRSGRSQVSSLLLTVYFSIGATLSLMGLELPFTEPAYLISLLIVIGLSAYVFHQASDPMVNRRDTVAYYLSTLPAIVAFVGFIINLYG